MFIIIKIVKITNCQGKKKGKTRKGKAFIIQVVNIIMNINQDVHYDEYCQGQKKETKARTGAIYYSGGELGQTLH